MPRLSAELGAVSASLPTSTATLPLDRPRDEVANIRLLGRDSGWQPGAIALLAELGFSLVNSDRPAAIGSHLVAAFREPPTLRHFDPESVTFYAAGETASQLRSLDRASIERGPGSVPLLWGHVHLADRLGVENRFLTFGGELRTAAVDRSLSIIDLRSPGPIVRWGGHSQGVDVLAEVIGAFFGRLIVLVDFDPTARRRLLETSPLTLYAAFLLDETRRVEAPLSDTPDALEAWLFGECHRLRELDPSACADATILLADLGLAAVAA